MVELARADGRRRASTSSTCRSCGASTRSGCEGAERARARRRRIGDVVRLPDGAVLNRYWDDRDTPRDESYLRRRRARRSTCRAARANEVYRDLRAAAESGWDFSSRWFGDGADARDDPHDGDRARRSEQPAVPRSSDDRARAAASARDCGVRDEYIASTRRSAPMAIDALSLEPERLLRRLRLAARQAARRPLGGDALSALRRRRGAAASARTRRRAPSSAQLLAARRPRDHRRAHAAQQWDAPNGWAPLQWIAIEGLHALRPRRHSRSAIAHALARRREARLRAASSKLVEKYDRRRHGAGGGGGGEYPLQDGFGWTNGVTLKFLDLYGGGE